MALPYTKPTIDSPAPAYGIRGGFNISDLSMPYQTSFRAITDTVVTATSAPILNWARGIELTVTFAQTNTVCDVVVQDGSAATIYQQLGVTTGNGATFYATGAEGVELGCAPYQVMVTNIVNPSLINVYVRKCS